MTPESASHLYSREVTALREQRADRLYAYLTKEGGWIHRERLMREMDIHFGTAGPVGAYVMFENALIALNRRLRPMGHAVLRSPVNKEGRFVELYRLERVQ